MSDYSVEAARAWAQGATSSVVLVEREAAKALLDLLPSPTVDEVGWDWDTHHMAGAISPQEEEVIMLWYDDDANLVICAESVWRPDELTPTGRHYKLIATDEQSPHTRYLTTLEELDSAVEGTVIVKPGSEPHMMDHALGWISPSDHDANEHVAENLPWQVLRWGWQL